MNDQKRQKIIIRPPGGLKELVLSLPYIEAIISHFENSKVVILAEKKFEGMFDHFKAVKCIYFQKKPRFAPSLENGEDVISFIQKGEFDYGVVFPESFSSAYLFYQGMVKKIAGFERTFSNFMLTDICVNRTYQGLLTKIGIHVENTISQIKFPKRKASKLQIGIDPSVDDEFCTLNWYGDFIALLIEELPYIDIEIINSKEVEFMRKKDSDPIIFTEKKQSVKQYLQKINNFDVFLTKDEGLQEIAKAVKTPCVNMNIAEGAKKLFPEDVLLKLRKALLEPLKEQVFMQSASNFVPITSGITNYDESCKLGLKVGVIVLAGGKGRRLGLDVPKGLLKIGGNFLYDIIIDKAKGAHKIGILTSPVTSKQTKEFFKGRNIDFFEKRVYPTEESDGVSPEGNGAIFDVLVQSKYWDTWKNLDIISVVAVDNPLADALDPCLITTKRELAVIGVKRDKAEKRLGVLCLNEKSLAVKEYFSLGKDGMEGLGYSGSFAAKPSFFEKVASKTLPFYRVEKKNSTFYERLVIDGFSHAESFDVIEKERDACFFPIKEKRDLFAYNKIENDRS